MPTIYDVSLLAGVSLATVSRVVNHNDNVSEKTRNKVLSAMESLGYQPNSIAQSLASNRSNSVGLLVSHLDGPFYGTMMKEIEASLRTHNKHVIIAAGHSNQEEEKSAIEFLLNRGCDALIMDVEAVSDDYLIKLAAKKTPIILINRHIEAIKHQCIYLDNEQGGYLATTHLLSLGHRNIAYIGGPEDKLDAQERLQGHKKALAQLNIEMDPKLYIASDFHENGGYQAMTQLLKFKNKFTAVICANDLMASGAIAKCQQKGLNIPNDMSIIGYDNIALPLYSSPQLTTINNPIKQMGAMAASWVLQNVYHNKDLVIANLFQPNLVIRNSTHSIDIR